MPTIRTFIALPSSPELTHSLSEAQTVLKESSADVKWEPPAKFHLTLKFLGNVERQTLDRLADALQAGCTHQPRFNLTYRTAGAFPSDDHPTVIWVGADIEPELAALHRRVEDVCHQFGFARDDRPFHPHITLGRVKGSRNIRRLTEKLKSLMLAPTHSPCTELLVMNSELRPSGSVYTVFASIPLNAVTPS